jgi:ComEC/Rec2-related protein
MQYLLDNTEVSQSWSTFAVYIKIASPWLVTAAEGGMTQLKSWLFNPLTTTNLYQYIAESVPSGSYGLYSANEFLQLKKAPWIAYFTSHIFLNSVNTWATHLLDIKRSIYNHLAWKAIGYFQDPSTSQLWQALFLGSVDQQGSTYLLFKHSGILHALAVSGSNLTMLSNQAQVILNRFSRPQRFFIWVTIVVSYTFLVGDQPSLVRAAVMSVWTAIGQTMGRKVTFSWALLLSVSTILWCMPRYQDSLSFQLSVVAVAGVCMTQAVLIPLTQVTDFFGLPAASQLVEPVSVGFGRLIYDTILATALIQLWVAPLLLLNFGEMSLRGVLISPVLIFLIPTLMKLVYWSALALMMSSVQLLAVCFFPVLVLLRDAYVLTSSVLLTTLSIFDQYAPELVVRYQLSLVQVGCWYIALGGWWWLAVYWKARAQRQRTYLQATELCI